MEGLSKPHREIGSGHWRGAQSKSFTVSAWISPMIRVCVLATKRSINLCIAKAEAHSKRELIAALRTGRALHKPRTRSHSKPHRHVTDEVVVVS